MMASWKAFAARIDALGLRERVFLFLAVILICVAVVDAWWVTPERLRHQLARQQFEANTLELQRLRDESRLNAMKPQSAQQARDDLVRVQAQIDTTNQDLAAVGAGPQGTTSLPDVLRHFLRRYPALGLVRTGNIAAETATATPPATVSREGLELTVTGPYADLVRFVQTLETAMPDLRWGSLKLQAEHPLPELTLQVFLVGVRP
jgi:MSHA biogenesis protein MshJ